MDPTLEEKQNNQPQQKRSTEGTISQGINAINNLARARRGLQNPLGKVGTRIAAQIATKGRLLAFLTSPAGLVLVVTIVVLVFTFILIIGFGGAPSSETISPTNEIAPTETPTLSPAEP